MNYAEARPLIETGDLLAIKGKRSILSTIVRIFGRSDYTHTGTAVWIENGLWLAEIDVFGYNHLIPVSQIVGTAFDVFNCPVPDRERVRNYILESLRTRVTYSYSSLILIGIEEWFRTRKLPNLSKSVVCSEYSLRIYTASGWDVPDERVSPKMLTDMMERKLSVAKD